MSNPGVLRNGFLTGLTLQLALGPVFFYIINLAIRRSPADGFFAVCAATIVDYLYITLAIFGIGKILEMKRVKRIFGIASSVVLVIFAGLIMRNAFVEEASFDPNLQQVSYANSFFSVFLLTISSPLTIVFFTGLFATKAIEHDFSKGQLLLFGLSTGAATMVFLGISVILFHLIGAFIPAIVISVLNFLVGLALLAYGVIRLVKVLYSERFQNCKSD